MKYTATKEFFLNGKRVGAGDSVELTDEQLAENRDNVETPDRSTNNDSTGEEVNTQPSTRR